MIWFIIFPVYTNDDNIIFYSLPEQHSQPDVKVILEKMEDVRSLQKKKKITKSGKNKIKIMQKIKRKYLKKW